MPFNIKGECRNIGGTHFKKGHIPWSKGKVGIYSEESRNKIGEATSRRLLIFHPFKGKHLSDEVRKKISSKVSQTLIGNTRTKGKPWSENRRKVQDARKGIPYKRTKIYVRDGNIVPKPIIMNGREYHFDWYNIRKQIYNRDGWTCQECGVHCSGNGTKNKIQCHHIDSNITNNNFSNLITLCASCHMKTYFKNKDWKDYYEKIMKGRGLIISEN